MAEDTGEADSRALSALRARIDEIDAEMHRLLIERGTVIDALIKTKRTDRAGAAFRPGREADMMRRIVARHAGALPIATVEHIWREIISTFTCLQAPFDVAVDMSTTPEDMRDLARFTFGYSVKLVAAGSPEAAVEAVGQSHLALVSRAAQGLWWRRLGVDAGQPRIMAYLPFIRAEGRPADTPAFVIAPPLADPVEPDISVFAVRAEEPITSVVGVEILAAEGLEYLIAVRDSVSAEELPRFLNDNGVRVHDVACVGGFARGIAIGGLWSVLYERVSLPS